MSYCDDCFHKAVCGNENAGDEAMIYCSDRTKLDEIIRNIASCNGCDPEYVKHALYQVYGREHE